MEVDPHFRAVQCTVSVSIRNLVLSLNEINYNIGGNVLLKAVGLPFEDVMAFIILLYYTIDMTKKLLVVVNNESDRAAWQAFHATFVQRYDGYDGVFELCTLEELWADFPHQQIFSDKNPLRPEDRQAVVELGKKFYSYNKESPMGFIDTIPLKSDKDASMYYNKFWDTVVVACSVAEWRYFYAINGLCTKSRIVVNTASTYLTNINQFRMLYLLSSSNEYEGDGPITSPDWNQHYPPILPVKEQKLKRAYQKFIHLVGGGDVVTLRKEEVPSKPRAKRIRKQPAITPLDPLPPPSSVHLTVHPLPYCREMVALINKEIEPYTSATYYTHPQVLMRKVAMFRDYYQQFVYDPSVFIFCRFGSVEDISSWFGDLPTSQLIDNIGDHLMIRKLFLLDSMYEYPPEMLDKMVNKVAEEIIIVANYGMNEDEVYFDLYKRLNPHLINPQADPKKKFTISMTRRPIWVTKHDELFNRVAEYENYLIKVGQRATALKLHSGGYMTNTPLFGFNEDGARYGTLYDVVYAVLAFMGQQMDAIIEYYHYDFLKTLYKNRPNAKYKNMVDRELIEQYLTRYIKPYYHEDMRNGHYIERFRDSLKTFLASIPKKERRSIFKILKEIIPKPVEKKWNGTDFVPFETPVLVKSTRNNILTGKRRMAEVKRCISLLNFQLHVYQPTEVITCRVTKTKLDMRNGQPVECFSLVDPPPTDKLLSVQLDMPLLMLALIVGMVTHNELISSELTLTPGTKYRTTLGILYQLMNPFERYITEHEPAIIYFNGKDRRGVVGADTTKDLPFDDLRDWIRTFYDNKKHTCFIDFFPRRLLADFSKWCQTHSLELKVARVEGFYYLSETTDFVSVFLSRLDNFFVDGGI